jgi:hypothetical protein
VTSALELMSKNIFCGSVRIVYAIIYTLFLVSSPFLSEIKNLCYYKGFGLTIGSDFYLVADRRARRTYYRSSIPEDLSYTHGRFLMANGSEPFVPLIGVLGQGNITGYAADHMVKG